MSDITTLMMGAAGAGGGAETDPNFNQTTLLLHGDGTNGAQNNTFLDSSTNNFTITRNGNTTQGTFSPFSLAAGEFSNFFDGTNDRLTIADNAVLRPGTGNFTIEAWVYRAAAGAAHTVFAKGGASTGFVLGITSGNVLRFTHTTTNIDSTGTVAANDWVHVAVVREGTGTNQVKLYINGVQDGQGTVSTDFNQTEEARIGENRGATDDFNGYISNFRYVVGSAIYTTAFTPSTSPLTTTSQGAVSSEVELLTCQSNRFLDNSTNGFTVTPVNNTSVQPFSPFLPSAAYSSSVNGGSGFFGTGNYLTAPDDNAWDLTSSTGSIEMFLYSTTTQTNGNGLVGQNSATGDWGGYVYADGRIAIGIQGSSELVTASGNLVDNSWIHVVFTRDNSTGRTRTFVNGVLKATGTGTYFANSANPLQIINFNDGVNRSFIGYVADIRFCKGSIPTAYQTASTTVDASIFTPPTAPLTVSSQGATSADTELLLNFTNAGIFDNTGKNNLETAADAQIDTSVKQYGTGSMEFDGTGDYLLLRNSPELSFGAGAYTVEFWLNTTATGGWLIYKVAGDTGFRLAISGNGDGVTNLGKINLNEQVSNVDNNITSTSTINDGNWHHIAIVREAGSGTRIYIDGTSEAQQGGVYNFNNAGNMHIGAREGLSGVALDGYIDDLRITKGVARYTAAFTPPTAAFPNL